jgi:hypothetical protein
VLIFVSIAIILYCASVKSLKETLTNNNNIVLLGDSILNNSNYVPAGKSILDILKQKTKNVYSYAKDEATIQDCYDQLNEVPMDLNNNNTYFFISAGGNNILNSRVQMDDQSLNLLFNEYIKLIGAIKTKFPNINLNVLNLYVPSNPRFETYRNMVQTWNNLISKNSTNVGEYYNVVDIYKLLKSPEDFVYDIEPSAKASVEIATMIFLTQ